MLVIRPEQLDAFAAAAHARDETRLIAHVRAAFPRQWAGLEGRGEAVVRERIDAARAHGLTSLRALGSYLNLLFTLGLDCEQRLPWIGEMLRDPALGAPELRLAAVREHVIAAMQEASRP
jgi:hypothetical protein